MSENGITITEGARETIDRMRRQAELVEQVWKGIKPEWATSTHATLNRELARILTGGFGDAKVFRDDDISLLVQSGITIGIIGFQQYRADEMPDPNLPESNVHRLTQRAPREGIVCLARLEDLYCTMPVVSGKPTCEGHQPDCWTVPTPINWSAHS